MGKEFEELPKDRFALDNGKYDQMTFQRIWNKREALQKQAKVGKEKYKYPKDLQQDMFSALFKKSIKDNKNIRKDHMLQRPVMEEIMKSDEFKHLSRLTSLKEWEAAEAGRHLTEKALDIMKEMQDKMDERSEQIKKAMADAKKNGKDGKKGPGQGTLAGKDPNDQHALIQYAMKKIDISKVLKESIRDVKRGLKKTAESLEGLGDYQAMSDQEKEKYSKLMEESRQAKEVLSRAPKMKRLANTTQKTKVKKGHDEIFDIESGNEISRVLPAEFIYLASKKKALKRIFYKNFIESSLQQYSLRANAKKTKGHFIICVDNSGSMGGEPIIQAKSFAVGVLERARKEKRSFYGVDFSGPGETEYSEFKNGEISPEELIQYAERFMCGGTCFTTALQKCMDLVDDKLPDTHIIFITDGADHVNPDFLKKITEWKESTGAQIHGLLIDAYHADMDEMRKFCDSVRKAIDLEGSMSDYAEEIFLNI
jgi:uncharacterized protein with von Willebrand factor type A (vWA) domain